MNALKDMKAILTRFLENINSKFIKKRTYGEGEQMYSIGLGSYEGKYSGIYVDGNRSTPTVDLCCEQVRVGVNGTALPFVTKYIWDSNLAIDAHTNKSTGYANMPAGYIPVATGICYDDGTGMISFKLDSSKLVSGSGDNVIYSARILMVNTTPRNFNSNIKASVFCVHHSLYQYNSRS